MLGRKQNVRDQGAWERAFEGVRQSYSRADLDLLAEHTISEIREVVRASGGDAAYAWSGGKDSIVLAALCEWAGVGPCVLVVTDLEYPAFSAWVAQNEPLGLEVVNTRQNLAWLAAHPHMLFPTSSATSAAWFSQVQHRGQALYFLQRELGVLLLGRRRRDGNYIGGADGVYTSAGVTRYSPMRDWSHEDVFAALHHWGLSLPPNYGWADGYKVGTGPWAKRRRGASLEATWAMVAEIDPDLATEARRFLRRGS